MPTYADVRAHVRERLVALLGDLVTDNDVQATCQDIYVAFMATLDLRPKHLSVGEVDAVVESVDALWSEELELFSEAAKRTLDESRREGLSPGEAAMRLQTTIEHELLGKGGGA